MVRETRSSWSYFFFWAWRFFFDFFSFFFIPNQPQFSHYHFRALQYTVTSSTTALGCAEKAKVAHVQYTASKTENKAIAVLFQGCLKLTSYRSQHSVDSGVI